MNFIPTQLQAIGHYQENLQLISCAGSGKTEVVVRRVANLLKNGLTPRHIVVFTFINKAAAELKEHIISRRREELGEIHGMAEMYVGTIHTFCLELLKNEVPKYLKYDVLNEVQHSLFIDRYSTRSGLTTSTDLNGRPLQRYKDTQHYLSAISILWKADVDKEALQDCSIVAALDEYRDLLDDTRYFDYSAIMEAAVYELTNTPEMRDRLTERIQHVIVDAYQDVRPIRKLSSCGEDSMQCPQCQHENQEGAKFCSDCGTPLPVVCASCQTANRPSANFCDQCGTPLAAHTSSLSATQHLAPRAVTDDHTALPRVLPLRDATLQTSTPPALADEILASQSALDGERKQVTVLFADISGFTALAETLDPEDVRQVMNACFAQLVPAVETYGGTIDKFIGDEIMALFGAPIAYDNDAERAVRAALAMQEALVRFNTVQGTTLGLHCGLNTGLVIAGEIGTQSRHDYSVMGDAVNLAARLEDASERGQIFVGPETYHLTHTLFRYARLAPMTLKGKTNPVQVYQVLGLRDAPESHEMDASTGLPLVGRASELALLLDRWAQATQGLGQVVVLSGEAGIGKSRLAVALGVRIVQEGSLQITIRCSPYHTNSALYPIMARLERLLQGANEEPAAATVGRLEQLLRPTGLPLEPVVPLLAALLSVPLPEGRYTPLRLSPQQQKQQTLEALVSWLLAEAAQQPVLSVWEDVHWADPSTLELLELLLRQVPTARMLVVATCRPPFQPPWGMRSYHTPLMLSRLGPPQIEQMVAHVTAGKALPPEVIQQVMAKTDGVPLFVEECVKMVLESSLVREEDGQYVLTGPLPPLAISPTLQEVLMARLDQLVPGKTVAQLGATVGREFAYELLVAISPLAEPVLRHGLGQLVEAELLYQRGHLPQAQYIFKHVLIQEAAYQSLLRSTRQQYHQRIAQVLAKHFPETVEMQPELLAHHYMEAGLAAQAIPYWQRAGQHASDRSAHLEAVSHFTTGIALLQTLPETPARLQQALPLHIGLGAALQMAKGVAAPEVEHAYNQAHALCQQLGETPQLVPVLFGLFRYYIARPQLQMARELGETLLRLAHRTHDSALAVLAHYALGWTWFWLGAFPAACQHLEAGLARYTPDQRRALVFRSGQDPGVGCGAFAAWGLWVLGYPDQSLARLRETLALAHALSDPISLAFARCWAGLVYQLRREVSAMHEQIEALVALAAAQGFPFYVALGTSGCGWVLAIEGQSEEGITQIRQGIAAFRATGAASGVAFLYTMLADAAAHLGHPEDGLQALAEAHTLVEQHEERVYEAEIYRLRGILLLQQTGTPQAEAETWLQRALDVARRQEAKSLELRAATSLARLWQQQDKRTEAHDLLAPVYTWFTEGFDTVDLQEAKTLLEELEG